jgi:hypothetical protein
MLKRRLRTSEELDQIFRENPDRERLYGELKALENVVVQPDGTGAAVFKVYLPGRMGWYEAFLRVNMPLDGSYVQWAHQGGHVGLCRDLWGSLVRNRKNPDGSQLQEHVDVDSVLETIKRYAELAASAV